MDELGKRQSGYRRMKAKAEYLSRDVNALERLVGTLLNHLERAIDPTLSDAERASLGIMVATIRTELAPVVKAA
jgi:predicted secreted protein